MTKREAGRGSSSEDETRKQNNPVGFWINEGNLETVAMRALFVHERFGAFGGAEANILLTAGELRSRSHTTGILHGSPTGRAESQWTDVFPRRFLLRPGASFECIQNALW